jgi:hypothetical protein
VAPGIVRAVEGNTVFAMLIEVDPDNGGPRVAVCEGIYLSRESAKQAARSLRRGKKWPGGVIAGRQIQEMEVRP